MPIQDFFSPENPAYDRLTGTIAAFPSVCQVPDASHPNIAPLEGTICFFLLSAV